MNIFAKFSGSVSPRSRKEDSQFSEDYKEAENLKVNGRNNSDEDDIGQLSVDVYETSKEIIIETMIAGVKPEDLQISTTHESIQISGRREANANIREEQYMTQELYWGSFSRTIELPADIAVDEAEAVEKHGLLIVRLPKIDKDRNIKVKVKSLS